MKLKKKGIIAFLLRAAAVLVVLLGLLVAFMRNPQVLYARHKSFGQVTVHSHYTNPDHFKPALAQALELVKQSELYDSLFRMHLFVNDGVSTAPVLKFIFGDAFAWGYADNAVLNGQTDGAYQFIELNHYRRHLSRTIAHEMIHCLQAKQLGLLHARPLKNIPVWKWEGYPEYIAYRSCIKNEKNILIDNIAILLTHKNESYFPVEIDIDEGKSFAGLDYFRWWLMIKYLADIRKMNFPDILSADVQYESVYDEMINWFVLQKPQAFSPPAGP